MDKKEVYFNATLFIICLAFLIVSFGYNPGVRTMPILVGTTTTVFVVIQIFSLLIKKKLSTNAIIESTKKEDKEKYKNLFGKQAVTLFLWLLALLVMIYLFGLMYATPLFIFLFFLFYSKEKLWKSILYALIIWAVIFFIFKGQLMVPFERGLFI